MRGKSYRIRIVLQATIAKEAPARRSVAGATTAVQGRIVAELERVDGGVTGQDQQEHVLYEGELTRAQRGLLSPVTFGCPHPEVVDQQFDALLATLARAGFATQHVHIDFEISKHARPGAPRYRIHWGSLPSCLGILPPGTRSAVCFERRLTKTG